VDRREQLVQRLDQAWVAFNESYAGLSDAALLEPDVTGAWSVRDILAHVTTWEEEALKHLPLILKSGTPPRYSVQYGGIDAFNALMTAKKRNLSLCEVRAQLVATHSRLINFVQTAPKYELIGDTRFCHRLRLDTYNHYPLHAEAIRQWRRRISNEADPCPQSADSSPVRFHQREFDLTFPRGGASTR
jgi:hypothetical protein